MVKFRRKSVSLSDLWISSNDKVSDFYALSWQPGDSPVPLLIIRIVLATVALSIVVFSLVGADPSFWLIFLTNWAMALVTFMMCCAVAVSCLAVSKKGLDTYSDELPWYVSMYWLMFNVALTLSLMVTALYWILLYDPDTYWIDCTWSMFALDMASHVCISLIALLELVLSRTPVRILHVYQPLGVATWYIAFTAIYYSAGGTDGNGNPYIYAVLDWGEGRRTLIIIGLSLIGLLIVYAIVWGIALGRDKLSISIRSSSVDLSSSLSSSNIMSRSRNLVGV